MRQVLAVPKYYEIICKKCGSLFQYGYEDIDTNEKGEFETFCPMCRTILKHDGSINAKYYELEEVGYCGVKGNVEEK